MNDQGQPNATSSETQPIAIASSEPAAVRMTFCATSFGLGTEPMSGIFPCCVQGESSSGGGGGGGAGDYRDPRAPPAGYGPGPPLPTSFLRCGATAALTILVFYAGNFSLEALMWRRPKVWSNIVLGFNSPFFLSSSNPPPTQRA